MRRAVWIVLGSLTLVAALLLFVLPGRIFLAGRRSLNRTEAEISVLSKENARLNDSIRSLQTPAEIEKLARQRYGLVLPGEQAYAILPSRAAQAPSGGK
jgi:cell division protein FtsB